MPWTGYTEWLSATRIAEELGISVKKVREWPLRKKDPLPVRYPEGNTKQWRVFRQDLNDWLLRNWEEAAWS